MGPLGKIAAFFSSNTSLHHSCSNNNAGPTAKELKKAANAAQLAIKRRNKRNEWYYGEAGVPPEVAAVSPIGGSSEDVRAKFSRRNPVWSSLRDLRSGRRNHVHADIPRNVKKAPDDGPRGSPHQNIIEEVVRGGLPRQDDAPHNTLPHKAPPPQKAPDVALRSTLPHKAADKATTLTKAPSKGFLAELFGGATEAADRCPDAPPAAGQDPGEEPAPPLAQTPAVSGQDTPAGYSSLPVPSGRDPAGPPEPQLVIDLDPSHPRPTSEPRTDDDHNGRVQLEPVAKQNGLSAAAAAVPVATRRVLANGGLRPGAPLAASSPNVSPGAPSPRSPRPTPQEVAAEVRKRLLPDLRHNAAAVEAMAALLDYTTNKLGAFAAPALRRDLEKMKSDMANTVIQLEEARAQYKRLEEEHDQHVQEEALQRAQQEARREDQERAMAELQQRLAGHDEQVQSIRTAHAGELEALRAQIDSRELEAADAVAVATRGLREEYEMELDRVTRRHEETLRAALGAARAEADREAAQLAQEAARREAEVAAQLKATEAAHAALREQSRRVMDSMKSDKDARTQALAARCRELQDEVDSLRSVLELRCDELQKSRRENDALRIAADQLPGAEQRISTLTARLEDLQVQLDRKGELESKLVMENSELQQSFCKEIKEKQMLSLQNEQLQFKLKQNTEVVNALAANMSDFHDVSAIMNASADRSRRNPSNNNNKGTSSPPESPRVKGVVEKSESVSYMLEMEMDSTDDVVARIYRRMASTPVSSPAHSAHQPHPRSAPPTTRRSAPATPKQSNPLAQSASATTIPASPSPSTRPTPKQRTTSASAASRVRSRSISSDSGECLSSGNWSPPSSLPQHQQEPQRGARTPDGLLAPSSGIGYDCSDIEDFSSSKSSSMSCSSEGSELGGLGPLRLGKERGDVDVDGDDEDVDEQAEAEVAPALLDLMTSSCGSTSITLPKDAGGEAMMEEMNEEVNGLNSSSEDGNGSCSDVDDDDSSGRGQRGHRGRLARLALPPMTPTAGGGCGQSAINTPMDSSWSEDMELPVSLSET